MTIAEQLNDVIDVLSERLGVAGDYVYQALMNQVPVKVAENIISLVFGAVIMVLTIIYCKKVFMDKDKNGDNRFDRAFNDYTGLGLVYIVGGLLLGIVLVVFVIQIPSILSNVVQLIANPEYYVLQQIMEMI